MTMYLQETLIGLALIACVLAYVFGITTGRMQQSKLCAEKLEHLRDTIFSERRNAHAARQALDNVQADLNRLTAMLKKQRTGAGHDAYTLRLAAHELELAARTFTALHSGHNHQAEQLSKALENIADRLTARPTLAANDTATPTGREEAA
tara:strand:+ start:257 stop:706 length:450 start_codon:yes stop_codon:yes gene_type:complete